MTAAAALVHRLEHLHPLGALSLARLRELADMTVTEVFRDVRAVLPWKAWSGQAIYLLRGELKIEYHDGASRIVVGDTEETRHPLTASFAGIAGARAVTEVEILRLDEKLVDLTITWDQLARGPGRTAKAAAATLLRAEALAKGVFAAFPPAHIDMLLQRFETVAVSRDEVILREGEIGDYYYLVDSGRCLVTRRVGGVDVTLAELRTGAAFGEEALVSDAPRNATVTMKTDGVLRRLPKAAFVELLRDPLVHAVPWDEALARVAAGARWLDVRYPPEYLHDGLPGALNIPLNELRESLPALDRAREYVIYCQSGRRSAAAAFLMAQRGIGACLLAGGLYRYREGAAGVRL